MSFDTSPRVFKLSPLDKVPVGIDMAPQLPEGGSVSSPELTFEPTGWTGTAPILPTPTVTGTKVVVTVTGPALVPEQPYLLTVVFTAGPNGETLSCQTVVFATWE